MVHKRFPFFSIPIPCPFFVPASFFSLSPSTVHASLAPIACAVLIPVYSVLTLHLPDWSGGFTGNGFFETIHSVQFSQLLFELPLPTS